MTQRSPALQAVLDKMAAELGITPEFDAASDHPYNCRCDICRNWWKKVGPEDADEDGNGGTYGPFTKEEIEGKGS